MGRAAIYARLSRRTETNAPNLDDQVGWCRAAAAERALSVVAEFRDEAESAFERDEDARPGYAELAALVRDGGVDVVVARAPDRLWRDDVTRALFLRDCQRKGVRIVTAMGEVDASAPGDRMLATITGAIGQYESAVKSARSLAKAEQRARAGLPNIGGSRAFGFEDDRMTPRPDEAAILVDLVDQVLAGATIGGLTVSLNERGIATAAGGRWQPNTLKRVLTAHRIAGLRSHRDREYPAAWPALVAPHKWRAARALIVANRKHRAPRAYPLTGILVCGRCGERLIARPRDDGARCYVCPPKVTHPGACSRLKALAIPVEEHVRDAVIEALDGPELSAAVAALDGAEDRIAEGQHLAALRDRLADLGASFAGGRLSVEAFEAADRALRDQVDATTLALASSSPPVEGVVGRGGELAAAWPGMTAAEQHDVVAAVVEAIDIAPAVRGRNFFDPARVAIRWRF